MEEINQDKAKSAGYRISPAVIKRLPRYFRYLRELKEAGRMRISSGELSKMMNVTASQIRQDLNCFGGFGQQGYGYNVKYLYSKISEILGVDEGYRAIIVGAGHRTARSTSFWRTYSARRSTWYTRSAPYSAPTMAGETSNRMWISPS